MNLSDSNKYLKVLPSVVLTPVIDYSIHEVDEYFKTCPSFVTSGLRDANDQLRVVREYLKLKGLDKECPGAMICGVTDKVWSDDHSETIYAWQYGWSRLLNAKVIINPPLPAKVLLDYFGPTNDGVNRKGNVIGASPHSAGLAFNVGGGNNGPQDEAACIEAALKGGVRSVASYLLERNNNALHVNCRKV